MQLHAEPRPSSLHVGSIAQQGQRMGGLRPPPWPLPTSEMAPNPSKMPLDVTTRLSLEVRGVGTCPPLSTPPLSLEAIERINLSGFMAGLSHPTKPT